MLRCLTLKHCKKGYRVFPSRNSTLISIAEIANVVIKLKQ